MNGPSEDLPLNRIDRDAAEALDRLYFNSGFLHRSLELGSLTIDQSRELSAMQDKAKRFVACQRVRKLNIALEETIGVRDVLEKNNLATSEELHELDLIVEPIPRLNAVGKLRTRVTAKNNSDRIRTRCLELSTISSEEISRLDRIPDPFERLFAYRRLLPKNVEISGDPLDAKIETVQTQTECRIQADSIRDALLAVDAIPREQVIDYDQIQDQRQRLEAYLTKDESV